MPVSIDGTGVGTWRIDLDAGRLEHDATTWEMLGHAPRAGVSSVSALLAATHPADRARVAAAWDDLRDHGTTLDVEFRVVRPDGAARWLRGRASRSDGAGTTRRATGSIIDVTEQRELRERLRDSEAMAERGFAELESVYRSAPVGLGVLDRDLRFVRVNDRLAAMHGVAVSDHIGRTIREVVPGLADSVEPVLRRVLQGETVLDVEIGGNTPAAPTEARTWNASYYPITDAAGSVVAINKVSEDVTERKRIMAELARGREQMHLAMRAARMFSFQRDLRTGATTYSEESTAILGLGGDHGGAAFVDVVHPDDRGRLTSLVQKLTPSQANYTTVYRVVRPDGGVVALEETARGVFDDQGGLVYLHGLAVDVTARETMIAALRESQATLALLTAAVPAMLFTCAPGGECDYVNHWFYEFSGDVGDRRDLGNWIDKVDQRDRAQTRALWEAAVAAGTAFGAELRFRAGDGTPRWFKVHAVPLADGGHPAKWIGVASDIDSVKRAQEELRKADRRKDEFLAMLAHELRNPLAPVVSSVNTLRLVTRGDPTLIRLADVISRQTRHMSRLLDDLLEVSRITAGRIRLRLASIDARLAVEEAAEINRPLFEQRGQRLDVLVPDTPIWVSADLTRLVQALGNLLNNASKYTPNRGAVAIEARADHGQARVSVRDSGIGIDPEVMEGIFDLFTQGGQTLDRAEGGLGIGLALVKRIAELHGGSVSAASDGRGKGSRFDVWLPLAPGREHADVERPMADVSGDAHDDSGQRVLVVDDNVDAAEVLAKGLTLLGHDVRVAFNGPEALSVAREFKPHVAVLDLGLPGLDGFEVARQLRTLETCRSTRLIALTGYGQTEHKNQSTAAGFEHHFVKPVELEDLTRVIGGR